MRMVVIERDNGGTFRHGCTNGFERNLFCLGDNTHRLGNNALTSRLHLSHTLFSSAGIILFRLAGLISASKHRAW